MHRNSYLAGNNSRVSEQATHVVYRRFGPDEKHIFQSVGLLQKSSVLAEGRAPVNRGRGHVLHVPRIAAAVAPVAAPERDEQLDVFA